MIVYRVGKTSHAADLSGEGARLNGGRWNHKMVACIYTSESRALAIIEYTMNVNINDIPRALSITTLEIPGGPVHEPKEADLPGNWKEVPAPSPTKDFGSNLLKAPGTLIIKVPSTAIPQEYNYILNPAHPAAKTFKIIDISDFVYPVRIKLV